MDALNKAFSDSEIRKSHNKILKIPVTVSQNGCCRALESTAGELAESKADRRFAALSGARTALYSAGKVTAR
jgi:hypothetical protein